VRRWILVAGIVLSGCAPVLNRAEESEQGVADAAVDGQFTFVVESFECGESEVNSGIFKETADGEFCLLDLTVTNTGDQGRHFLAGIQGLFSYAGGRLTPSNEATVILNAEAINEEINPGLSISATVVFDIADPDEIEFAHLKDAPLSQGVKVRLGQASG